MRMEYNNKGNLRIILVLLLFAISFINLIAQSKYVDVYDWDHKPFMIKNFNCVNICYFIKLPV